MKAFKRRVLFPIARVSFVKNKMVYAFINKYLFIHLFIFKENMMLKLYFMFLFFVFDFVSNYIELWLFPWPPTIHFELFFYNFVLLKLIAKLTFFLTSRS